LGAEFQDDPSAPVFFLSYARAKRPKNPVAPAHDANDPVHRLFRDLTENVNQLIAFTPGQDPGFVDTTMDGGERWRKQLLRTAGTCQIFICLLSEPYLHSRWCAMEWDIFSRRRIVRRADGEPDDETGIVPVLWAPTGTDIPPVIADVNRFAPKDLPDPNFGPQYQTNGLLGLLRIGYESAWEAVVWKLAMHIQRLHFSHWVEPLVPANTEGLRQDFTDEAWQTRRGG
jgi:hypothetical protein